MSRSERDLDAYRAAAVESETLMRATDAAMRSIIEETRILIEDGHEAMRRADALLAEAPTMRDSN
jgi:hypothetical protein